jgi:hypothetical protein
MSEIVEKGVDHGVRVMTGRGMNGDSRVLVDDEYIVVLVQYIQVHGRRLERGLFRRGDDYLDGIAGLEPVVGFSRGAVDMNQALGVQVLLNVGTGKILQPVNQKEIEPDVPILFSDGKLIPEFLAVPQFYLRV